MGEQETKDTVRKRAPRAPADPLPRALDRALKLYEREGRHVVPADVAAKDLGYKDATSGAARIALATLRQYGLLTRPNEGQVAVAKEVEDYKFSPDKSQQQLTLVRWLRTPVIYSHLLDKYSDRLPSDEALRYDLIKMGFPPDSAEEQVGFFKGSVDYCDYYNNRQAPSSPIGNSDSNPTSDQGGGPKEEPAPSNATPAKPREEVMAGDFDRIPVRLTGGRRAFLIVPVPFYEADKKRMKDQIELLLADEQKSGEDLV